MRRTFLWLESLWHGLHLRKWSPDFDPFQVKVNLAPVWIHLSGLSIIFWHEEIIVGIARWQRNLGIVAGRFAAVGATCLAFLFFPITRGSVLLRLLNTSFEVTVKYHIWLGHITMALFTIHGMAFVVKWGATHQLAKQLKSWERTGCPHLAGEIALLAGLTMWLTSLKPIRRRFFEVFYYTHHLYLVFILFYALHVGDTMFSLALPGIFLFLLDRYLRLLQSRKMVRVISARKLPSKMVHLVIAKHPGLKFNPLSIILLRVPHLSHLQWHPFSIVSTASIDSDRFSLLIKCQQGWTQKLDNLIGTLNSIDSPLFLEVGIEGPYGPSSNTFLSYDALILVGGGSGMGPLMSVLSEVLHQHSTRSQHHVPSEVIVIFSVRRSAELCILNLVCPSMICSNYSQVLKLDSRAYVTQSGAPDSEMAALDMEMAPLNGSRLFQSYRNSWDTNGRVGHRYVHSITSINNAFWHGTAICASIIGFLFLTAMLNRFYIYPKDHNTNTEYPWWAKGLITILCIAVGIVIFGGAVYLAWYKKNASGLTTSPKRIHGRDNSSTSSVSTSGNNNMSLGKFDALRVPETLLSKTTLRYGQRPDFEDIIEELADKMDGKNVGVFACGPEGMVQSVASACRTHGSVPGLKCSVALDFHSISFSF